MNKKILLFLLIVISAFSFINVFALDEEENQYQIAIEDDASLLTEDEKNALEKEVEPLKKYGNVVFKSILENDVDTSEYARSYYNSKFGDNGVILLFDMANNYLHLSSYGDNYEKFNDDIAQKMIDDNISYATNKEYYTCSSKLFDSVFNFLEKESVEIEENNYKIIIEDDANLLSNSEIEQLKEKMMPLTEFGNIAFKTVNVNSSSAEYFARSYYHEKFGASSGSLFLIDMANRKIYIFSDGYNYRVITSSKADIITDNIYLYATNKEYYKCAESAFDQMHTLLDGGKIAEPMRHISNIVVALVVSFFLTFIYAFQKTKIKKASGDAILNGCDVTFCATNIVGTKTGTHSVYSPVSDSSSGGGSSGGGGGGGGSSGGGGGHSF